MLPLNHLQRDGNVPNQSHRLILNERGYDPKLLHLTNSNPMAANLEPDPFLAARLNMAVTQLRRRGIHDERVLGAMEHVPRHEFVAPQYWNVAYSDDPVPIGEGQTISQPYIVAYMLEALELTPDDHVLEIGTGTGYQAALLAQLAGTVISIERHRSLLEVAFANLTRLQAGDVTLLHGDGTEGWNTGAPYNAIIVAAAAPRIPPALVEQLAEGGRLIIPVGTAHMQELLLVHRRDNRTTTKRLEGCRFVPLIGAEGFSLP
jgi:protein-L-isoaspartate(D-aspartate) O-methyltransferase